MKSVLVILLSFACWTTSAQKIHNFERDPENTDCGGLDTIKLKEDAMARAVLSSTFRLQEEMQISRYSAPRKFVFSSCDGREGWLLSYQSDSVIHVYHPVLTSDWEKIRDATDPRETFGIMKDAFQRVSPTQ